MELETRILKVRKAIEEKKPKDYVNFKFSEYYKDYENLDIKSVKDKIDFRETAKEYFSYMKK